MMTDTKGGAPDQQDYSPVAAWSAVGVLFMLVVLSLLDRNILSLLIEAIKADLGLTDVEIGLIYGLAFAVCYALAALPAGWAIDNLQRRVVIFAGVSFWSLATSATAFASGFASLFAARAGVGMGEAVLSPGQQSMLPDLFPKDRLALPLSISALGLKVGLGAALLIGGALTTLFPPAESFAVPLLGQMKGWQVIFLTVGLPGFLLGTLIFAIPEPKRRTVAIAGSKPSRYADYFRIVYHHRRFFIGHHVGQLLFVSISLGVATWSPAFLARSHGWSEATIGLWLGTATLVGSVAGMPLHGFIADKLYQRGYRDIYMRYPLIGALAGCPIGIAAFLVNDAYVACALLGLFLFTICSYGSLPIVAVQGRLTSDMRGKAAGLMLIVGGSGGAALGPLIVAVISDHLLKDPQRLGDALAIFVAVGCPIVALLFTQTLRSMRETDLLIAPMQPEVAAK